MTYSLSRHHVDLWPVRLNVEDSLLPVFRSLLATDEVARASSFRFEHLRQRYTLAHGALRLLLGRYVCEKPSALRFVASRNGKPQLQGEGTLRFNISHANGIALIGVTAACEIGVDVETIGPRDDMLELAHGFFCPEEAEELMSVDPQDRCRAFYSCWTRKEAYVKATSDGLRTPLDSFRVSLRPAEPVRLLHINGSSDDAAQWTLQSVDHLPSCAAALAHRRPRLQVRSMPILSAYELC
jgi:4'-phosphopantetheinyl transferase